MAVQVDPIKPRLKAPGTKRLNLKHDGPHSKYAFKINLRRYNVEDTSRAAASCDIQLQALHAGGLFRPRTRPTFNRRIESARLYEHSP